MVVEKTFKSKNTFRQNITNVFKYGSIILGFSFGVILGLRYRRQYNGKLIFFLTF